MKAQYLYKSLQVLAALLPDALALQLLRPVREVRLCALAGKEP